MPNGYDYHTVVRMHPKSTMEVKKITIVDSGVKQGITIDPRKLG
jgi:hypothetical protein